MTEKTFKLTFEIFTDAKDIMEAVEKGQKSAEKSKYICDFVGVREVELDE